MWTPQDWVHLNKAEQDQKAKTETVENATDQAQAHSSIRDSHIDDYLTLVHVTSASRAYCFENPPMKVEASGTDPPISAPEKSIPGCCSSTDRSSTTFK